MSGSGPEACPLVGPWPGMLWDKDRMNQSQSLWVVGRERHADKQQKKAIATVGSDRLMKMQNKRTAFSSVWRFGDDSVKEDTTKEAAGP